MNSGCEVRTGTEYGCRAYLPRLKRLPRVNSTANFRDLTISTGVSKNAFKKNKMQLRQHLKTTTDIYISHHDETNCSER